MRNAPVASELAVYSGSSKLTATWLCAPSRQRSYPASVRSHVFQYCLKHDLVCNANLGNMLWHWPSEGKTHASYQFAAIGAAAAQREQGPPLIVIGGDLPGGSVSHSYDESLSASGGAQPYSWTVTEGSLPPGLALGDAGGVTGAPVQDGAYQFTAQVTDGNGHTASGTYSLTVAPSTSLPGQITEYDVSNDLGCAMFASGDTNGEFFGQDACGTFVAVGGQLYGPSVIPAGGNLGAYNSWTPIGQSTSGSGTSGDPFVTTTDASADGSPITISEADTYVVGGDEVAIDMTLSNSEASSVQLILYHGFDCYPGDSDFGTGTSSNGSVSCVSNNFGTDGARTLKLTPLTSGSTFIEELYRNLWSDIAAQGLFSDTVEADTHDTSEGLAWQVTVPANGSITIRCTTDLLNTQ